MLSKIYKYFTRKKRDDSKSPIGIEMKEFSPKRRNRSPSPSPLSSQSSNKATIGSVRSSDSVKRARNNTKKIYRQRIKNSLCRGRPKPNCLNKQNKKNCIFTKGEQRKYCRKKHNQWI